MQGIYREVAGAILIGTCGRLILQQRDDVPLILYPGMIGLFGGHREEGETFLDCVQREVREEIGCLIPLERFEPLMRCQANFADGGGINAEYFVAQDIPSDRLVVTEGRPLLTTLVELPKLFHRMAPSACFAVSYFMTTLADRKGGLT